MEEIGRHMPGGFFIYKAEQPEGLLYANRACFHISGCADVEVFRALTGYTFKGMVCPDGYREISAPAEPPEPAASRSQFPKTHMPRGFRFLRREPLAGGGKGCGNDYQTGF